MVRKIVKVVAISFGIVVCIILGVISYVTFALPDVGKAPDISIAITEERLTRGEYLAVQVSGCIACHSTRDQSKFSAPVVAGSFGMGGEVFRTEVGNIVAPNITPYALRDWTDGEIFRAITSGVSKSGSPLFPLMPYHNFQQMDEEDIYSIIVYLRRLEPIANTPPRTTLNFPMNMIVHTIPSKTKLGKRPPILDTLQYGKYLLTASNCGDCHSPRENGKTIPGLEFSGGNPFNLENGRVVYSPNITFDKETGIGAWNKETFIRKFKAALDTSYAQQLNRNDAQTVMPWVNYSKMTEYDLGAIYTYLKTKPSVKKSIKRL